MIFVIQKHSARQLHWDLRLEMDGVLKSWALPKQPPKKTGIKRLALQVEDHELDYAEFEGELSEGEYGAGAVALWDKGEYVMLEKKDNAMKFRLFGKVLQGDYVLVRFPKAGDNAWLFFKTKAVESRR